MPTILNPAAQVAASILFAAILLCVSVAVLHADEGHSAKAVEVGPAHCRMYFGCLPDLAKMRGRLN
jgi:hypothetical protein